MRDQQKKLNRWNHEYSKYQRMLDEIDQRGVKVRTVSHLALAGQKSSILRQKSSLRSTGKGYEAGQKAGLVVLL